MLINREKFVEKISREISREKILDYVLKNQ